MFIIIILNVVGDKIKSKSNLFPLGAEILPELPCSSM